MTLRTNHLPRTERVAAQDINDIAAQINANTTAIAGLALGTPTGPAGGDLVGSNFPNPVIAPLAITTGKLALGAATGVALGADVAKLVAGLVPLANLGAGTPNNTTYLRGDATWAVGTGGSLAALSDVLVTPVDGDILIYKGSASKWENYTRPERTFEFFGGSKTGLLAAQSAAWTAARVWSDSVVGGTIIFSAGLYPHMPKTELGNHMKISGAGILATRLQYDASITTGSLVFNHVSTNGTTDPNAWGCAIESLTIDGSLLPGWGTNPVNGITWNQNPQFGHATADSGELILNDTGHVIRDVLVYQVPADGVVASSMGSQHWEMVLAYNSGGVGFRTPFDSTIFNCTAGFSNKEGFIISGNPGKMVGCKAFSSGNVTRANGQGFHIVPGGGLAPIVLVGCEAQDNFAAGYFVDGASSSLVTLSACIADSNSARGAGTDPAFDILNSPSTQLVGCQASERGVNGNNQLHAVSLRGTSLGVYVQVNHRGTNGATVGSPFQTIDSGSGAAFTSINNLQGFQQTFSTAITPDLFLGGTVEVTGISGPATVAAPINGPYPGGTQAKFILKQDVTGGRTITWNAIYVNPPTTNVASLGYTIGSFEFDGTSWVRGS